MTELLQQTLFIKIEDLSDCVETEGDEENYVQTTFDILVSDFCTEIMSDEHVILGKTFAITEKALFAIIQYMKKPSDKKIAEVKGILTDM